ncbi:SNF2 domain-containing protein CLASSY 1 [Linum perenne]
MDVPLSDFFRARSSGGKGRAQRKIPQLEADSKTETSKPKRGRKRKRDLAVVAVPDADKEANYFEKPDSPPPAAPKSPENHQKDKDDVSFGYYSKKGTYGSQRKSFGSFNSKMPIFEAEEDLGFKSGWGSKSFARMPSNNGTRRRSFRPSKRDNTPGEQRTFKKTALSAGAYNKLINSYMKNIDSTISSKSESHIIDQWERFKSKGDESKTQKTEQVEEDDDGELSETEMLWREMELCLASEYILDRASAKKVEKEGKSGCLHEFKLDEEIGILCTICGYVKLEIKYVTPPFAENASSAAERNPNNEADESEVKADGEEEIKLFTTDHNTFNEEAAFSADQENVWALIPHIKTKLHIHQKKAFEFLWKNTAGSMIPAEMVKASKKIGGCVVSHTPGAGKTFLIIAFLSSFLRLFPNKRPLVLAPKTTLYTWYKEFIKWDIPIPVHLIHGRKTFKLSKQGTGKNVVGGGPKPSQDVMHIIDCLEKIQKWHAQPSVLVMGYTSFLTLMREDAKFAHRQYMAKVLRESPGLLILDEGHNPRSTKSRLRKVLMKVDTDLRILLSGDLELFERGRIIDKFEEPGGHSKVLLASITACAEGISLTAASRVILMDSEWNPSKTKQAIARAFRPGQQKVVYVYQLLATGTLEEDKYRRTTWKEWVSCMIFSEAFVEDPSQWQAEKIEDDVLREMVEEDRTKMFHMIMKNEKASTG